MFQIVKEKIEANYNSIERISKNPFVAMDSILAYLASTFVSNLYLIININILKWSTRSGLEKTIYFDFSSIFGDFFLKFFEEEVSDYLS